MLLRNFIQPSQFLHHTRNNNISRLVSSGLGLEITACPKGRNVETEGVEFIINRIACLLIYFQTLVVDADEIS